MSEQTEIIERERQFWIGTAEHYERWLADSAVRVFPAPVGVLEREQILSGIRDSSRWVCVEMSRITFRRASASTILLAYHARAQREGADGTYEAWVGSVYVSQSAGWMLAFHQQTPVDSGR